VVVVVVDVARRWECGRAGDCDCDCGCGRVGCPEVLGRNVVDGVKLSVKASVGVP